MTHAGPGPIVSTSSDAAQGASFVEWSAVLAGAFLAAALSFVFLTFGAAIGLSATSPWLGSGASAKAIGSGAVFFALVQQIGVFMAGGYVAGRMRSRWREPTQHEVEFRDGLHGGLVWAVGVLLGAALFMMAAGAAARTGAEVAGKTVGLAAASAADPMDIVLDGMLRSPAMAQIAEPGSQSASTGGPSRSRGATAPGDDARAEMARILASSVATGSMSDPNRVYLAQLVAQRSGLPQQEAQKRVDEAFTAARQAADKARRAAVLTGFVTAAALVLSLGAAWWAALKGGNHRDNSVPARFEFGAHRRQGASLT